MAQPDRSDPSPAALFGGFLVVGLSGFGAVLPWARRLVVERRGWLTPAEFSDLLALCQFLPGPNAVNFSVALGARFHGALGAAAAFSGLMAAPMAIVIGLGVLYQRYAGHPVVAHAFGGLAAAAAGLIFALTIQTGAPLWRNRVGLGVAALTFVALAVLRLPLLPTVLIVLPASVFLAGRFPPRLPPRFPARFPR